MDEKDLSDIYKVFYPTGADCTFSSVAHGTFSKIYHPRSYSKSQQIQNIEVINPLYPNRP
jgi:hypothetical protein